MTKTLEQSTWPSDYGTMIFFKIFIFLNEQICQEIVKTKSVWVTHKTCIFEDDRVMTQIRRYIPHSDSKTICKFVINMKW